MNRLAVLAIAPYPLEAAGPRLRIAQLAPLLATRGITLTLRTTLDRDGFRNLYDRRKVGATAGAIVKGVGRGVAEALGSGRYDVVLLYREALLAGPPLLEWTISRIARRPLVLDVDDAIWVPYASPTYGRLGTVLKWPGKADHLIDLAAVVTCGNRFIAEYVASRGGTPAVVPTVVDLDRLTPADTSARAGVPVLGWIGTHSTRPYLESVVPVLQSLARTHRFRLRVVGAGSRPFEVPGVEVEARDWELEREAADLRSFDIGLYPIVADSWAPGKSGLKSVQYMAVGVPFVVTPIGAAAEIGEPGTTHLAAASHEEWRAALARLLDDRALRHAMGAAGRRHALAHYPLSAAADPLADALEAAAR
jgi:glycosyltransferase involved in cell wall biosynthesis